ncbi:unnamed protein product [Phytophthora fragariaefolia]|uniref:Unnamed protein product n=1 Tax=Phytophthora fragariaefolia TaxID=1490495 RepID=A0A9W6U4E6_9STRA|nr:unnamed protein product [Phytophthora fragariaefolia]
MQQQADDRAYLDMSLKLERPPSSSGGSSYRLTLGAFGSRADDEQSGPRKLVARESVVTGSEYEQSEVSDDDDRPSLQDDGSFVEPPAAESEASRPPSFDDAGDSFFDEGRPSFSDEPSFSSGDSFSAADTSFVYRPSLPDDEDGAEAKPAIGSSFVYRPTGENQTAVADVQTGDSSFADCSFVYRPTLPESESRAEGVLAAPKRVSTCDDTRFIYRPTLPDNDGGTEKESRGSVGKTLDVASVSVDDSFVYRPTLPDDSTSEQMRDHMSTDVPTAEDYSFVYRPTLPGADDSGHDGGFSANSNADVAPEQQNKVLSDDGLGYDDDEEQPSFLSPSASSFIRSSDAVDFGFGGVDSSFRLNDADAAIVVMQDESLDSFLADSCVSSPPPKVDANTNDAIATVDVPTATSSVDIADKLTTPPVIDNTTNTIPASTLPAPPKSAGIPARTDGSPLVTTKYAHNAKLNAYLLAVQPPLSRNSSVSSTVSSYERSTRQRGMTNGSSRVSTLDFHENKHAFDEELGPLAGHQELPTSPAEATEQQIQRLSSTVEEHRSAVPASTSSSVTSLDSETFFVDDVQQTFPTGSSLSLDSRPSGDDSFANVAILGDDVHDPNERRSSDIITPNSGVQTTLVAKTYPKAPEALNDSYSDNLVDTSLGLDQSFSTLVNRDELQPDGGDRSAKAGTSLGSSWTSSALSTASDDLPFTSFNEPKQAAPVGTQENKGKQRAVVAAQLSREQQAVVQPSEPVTSLPIILSRGNDPKGTKAEKTSATVSSTVSSGAKAFSSAALLAAIKTREVRADTRSEETEAGDVAPGALPRLAPPLKINTGPHGRGSLSSSVLSAKGAAQSSPISGSPLNMSFIARSSVASSTGTADRLDFTGVYRGSANSLEASQNNGTPSKSAQAQAELDSMVLKQPRGDRKKANQTDLLAVKLERSKSDSRAVHVAAQRKVEAFFRNMGDIDEREVHRLTTRKTRTRTTVMEYMADVEAGSHTAGNKAAKIIDLKNLRNGGKRPGWHLENESHVASQQDVSSTQGAMAMTTRTTSTNTTATRSIPSDVIPASHNYVLSPHATGNSPQLEEKENAGVPKAANASGFGAARRAGNLSLTPTLARLSANESPRLSASPFVYSHVFGASGRSPGKSPVGFGATSGFLWKTGSGFKGMKRSVAEPSLDASHLSFSQRPTLAERVQSLSASLASTLRRFLPARSGRRHGGEITSPQSQCSAPASLPRAYDHYGFYKTPFEVPGVDKPMTQRRKQIVVKNDGAWARQWLLLAVCAVLGLVLGAILVSVVPFDADVLNLSADDVHQQQESNGELVLAAAVHWMLLPGHLFMRVWSAVTTPLLFCYVVTALGDLVGCADKSTLVLSFRSIGYALFLALLSTVEGVLAMWMTYKFGWFQGNSSTAVVTASVLSSAIGATPLPEGAVGLLCTDNGEYLQRLSNGSFACSNTPLNLPLYNEVSINSSGVVNSGPAVLALQEVTGLLATPTIAPYYPQSFGSEANMTSSLVSALTPNNLVMQFMNVADDEIASMFGLISFALLLGYFCGKRILRLRRDAQAAMFEPVRHSGRGADNQYKSRHYIMSIVMELQLALEWLVRQIERCLAPLGLFSMTLGHVVMHHREWRSFAPPMASLVVGVLIVFAMHGVLVLPMVLRLHSSSRIPVLTMARAFVPAFLLALTTDNLPLSAPVAMQCYARMLTVTRSAAQLVTAMTTAFTRNTRALYLPLLMLWLLETSTPVELHLTVSDFISMGLVSLLSCFCGGSSRVTLAMTRTVWTLAVSKQLPSAASLPPPTLPLLFACDVVLSRVASVTTVADHVVLTHLVAQYWTETVVDGPSSRGSCPGIGSYDVYVPSRRALDNSQVPRPSSSAMLSSVYL